MITIAFSGRRWALGSSYSISYSGYSRNFVVFDDKATYSIINLSPDSTAITRNFQHSLVGGKLAFPDHTVILRNADFNVAINFVSKTTDISSSAAAHSATGTMRTGADFFIDITTPLVFEASCIASNVYIPVGGQKSITVGTAVYNINYGDGTTCDNSATVTAGGKSMAITVNSDGN